MNFLRAIGDPKAADKLRKDIEQAAEGHDKRAAAANKAIADLRKVETDLAARQRAVEVREANAANVEKELQLRQKELRDLADAAVNDRRYAADELAKAQEAADEIVADADGKAAAAETKAKGALQPHAYISKLEKTKLILNKRIPHRT